MNRFVSQKTLLIPSPHEDGVRIHRRVPWTIDAYPSRARKAAGLPALSPSFQTHSNPCTSPANRHTLEARLGDLELSCHLRVLDRRYRLHEIGDAVHLAFRTGCGRARSWAVGWPRNAAQRERRCRAGGVGKALLDVRAP